MWKYLETPNGSEIASTLRAWSEERPGVGILALVSENDAHAVAMLQEAANGALCPLAGAIAPGLISEKGYRRKGIILLALDANIPQTLVPLPRKGMHTDDAAVAELAAFVQKHQTPNTTGTLLMFIDGMTPDVGTILDRLYLSVGNLVHYAGSNVGSETFQPVPCVFNNTSFVQDAALALLLPDHPGAALAHHYCVAASMGLATSTRQNCVSSINGQPAFDLYKSLVSSTLGVALTRENFYQHAVHFPLALQMAEGEPLVRIPVSIEEDGSLYCVGEVREASMLSIVKAPDPGKANTAEDVAAQLREQNPSGVLAFYCAGRLMQQGEEAAAAEIEHFRNALSPAPLFGILSLGEIANHLGNGYPRFHNATIVGLPWR